MFLQCLSSWHDHSPSKNSQQIRDPRVVFNRWGHINPCFDSLQSQSNKVCNYGQFSIQNNDWRVIRSVSSESENLSKDSSDHKLMSEYLAPSHSFEGQHLQEAADPRFDIKEELFSESFQHLVVDCHAIFPRVACLRISPKTEFPLTYLNKGFSGTKMIPALRINLLRILRFTLHYLLLYSLNPIFRKFNIK